MGFSLKGLKVINEGTAARRSICFPLLKSKLKKLNRLSRGSLGNAPFRRRVAVILASSTSAVSDFGVVGCNKEDFFVEAK